MPEARKATALTNDAVDRQASVDFQLTLRMRDFAKLQTRLSRGEKVSDQEMHERYFPLASDYQAIVAWVKSQGLTVLDDDPTHLSVRVRGPVATVERVLATEYAHVLQDGKQFLAAQTLPSLPARVAAPILGITGLQPYLRTRVNSTMTSGVPPYIPADVLLAYQGTNLTTVTGAKANGAGQTIAIIADRAPVEVDVTTFWNRAKVPGHANAAYKSYVTVVNLTGSDTLEAPVNTESTLDVSWATGVASGAQVQLYVAGSTDLIDIDKALQRIVSDTQPGSPTAVRITQLAISFSLEQGEAEAPSDEVNMQSQYYATLAARGVSIFVASGDQGSTPQGASGPEPEYPASDPSVTAVGGTSLLINRDTNTIASEIAWDNDTGASGGGISTLFPAPAYQTGNGIVGQDGLPYEGRTVPDVASVADPKVGAYLVFSKADDKNNVSPTDITTGGTSWSTPTWAAFGAIINQAREAAGLPDVGLLNPSIYALGGTNNFRDITARDAKNANPSDYPPGPGYDLITGLGSPVLSRLLSTLTNGGKLTVASFTPDSGIPGTEVVVNGTQLDQVVSVSFNGTTATSFAPVNATQLIAVVPNGATTGPIAVLGRDGTTVASAIPFTVLPADAGANNFFAAAQPVGPATTRLTGSNVGATKEGGEPDHAGNPGGASVWYRWSPPANGTFTLNTFGSSFDTLLAVYTGDSVATLLEVASNDDLSTSVTSSVVFDAVYGTTYYIAVDGSRQANGRAAQGTVVLNLTPANNQPVINDFTPARGAPGRQVRIVGANLLTVTSVRFNDVPATFAIDSATQITAYVPQGATTGPLTVVDTAGNTSTSPGYFAVVNGPANDLFANSQPITGTQVNLTGSNAGAFKEPGEPNHAENAGGASVWFSWTAPNTGVFSFNTFGSDFDTLLAVYTGDSVAGLSQVAANDDAGPLGSSSVTFNARGGVVYRVAVDGFNGSTGNYRLNLTATSGVPVITSFTPTSGGAGVSVVLNGTGFLTVTSVKFNGKEAPGFQANSDTQITVAVPVGATTGPITATGLNGTATSPSNFTVVALPPNDNFANSQLLTGGAPIVVTGTTAGATKEPGEPNIVPNDRGGRSIWYTFTPPASGDYIITTRGSDFDTLLGVFVGSTVGALTPVVSNDDDAMGGGVTSALTLTAQRGTTYRIVVDGAGGEAGNVVLSILNSSAVLNLYNTNFEPGEGFDSKQPLAGQAGWVSVANQTGGNGIGVNQIPNLSQQGLVGQTPLTNAAASIQVYHPFSYDFGQGDFPIVNFSTVLRIAGSTNGGNDRFSFSPGQGLDNSAGEGTRGSYFSVVFDNATSRVYYQYPVGRALPAGGLSSGQLIPTGVSFSRDVIYSLAMVLDYQSGRWSATLNGTPLVSGLPFYDNRNATPVRLTRISADWTPADPAAPGDGYMVFDQYSVNAPAKESPVIVVQPASQTILTGQSVTFSVVAQGTPPLQYQWSFEGRPIAGATGSSYTIPTVNPVNAGRYSVAVSNGFGTTTSLDAFLVVSTPQVPNTSTVEVVPQVSPINESGGEIGSVLLTRTGDLSGALLVEYAVHGTAQSGVDYVALDGRATIKAGRAKKRIKVLALDRGIRDGSEVKVTVKVLPGNGYSVGPSSKARVLIERQ